MLPQVVVDVVGGVRGGGLPASEHRAGRVFSVIERFKPFAQFPGLSPSLYIFEPPDLRHLYLLRSATQLLSGAVVEADHFREQLVDFLLVAARDRLAQFSKKKRAHGLRQAPPGRAR